MKIKQVLIYSLPISSEKGFVFSQSTVSFKVEEPEDFDILLKNDENF